MVFFWVFGGFFNASRKQDWRRTSCQCHAAEMGACCPWEPAWQPSRQAALPCSALCGTAAYCWGNSHPHSKRRLTSHRAITAACPNEQAVTMALQLTVQRDQHTESCRDPAAPRSEPERIQEGLHSPIWAMSWLRTTTKKEKKKINPQLSFSCWMLRGCSGLTGVAVLAP